MKLESDPAEGQTAVSAALPNLARRARARLGTDFFRLMPVLIDVLLALLSFELAHFLGAARFTEIAGAWPSMALYALLFAMAMYLNEMYSFWHLRRTAELIPAILRGQGVALLLAIPVLFLIPASPDHWSLALALSVQFALLLGWRTLLERHLLTRFGRQRVLILGAGERAQRVRAALRHRGAALFDVIGCTIDRIGENAAQSCRQLGLSLEVCQVCQGQGIDHIIVAQDNPRQVFPIEALLKLKRQGIRISEGEYFYERLMGKVLTDHVRPSTMIFCGNPMHHTVHIWIKNALDFVVAGALLVATLPLTLLSMLLIKLTSPGPIFYCQQRVGLGGRLYTIYKFRTMRADAEKDGVRWAAANDTRITWIGRFLRRSRIDELPQLVNVLKGEMSMAGPRPERPEFVRKLEQEIPYYGLRHTMRPGLSGWAQVRYRYGSSVEDAHEKLRYDLYYIKYYSLTLDLTILLETTKVVLFGSGAR